MSFSVPSRKVAALAAAACGFSVVLAGAFAPAATAATSSTSTPAVSTVAAKKSDWFVDPRTPAQRKAQVPVPKNPKKYRGKVQETRAVYRTRKGALAVPMRSAFGNKVANGQAVTLDGDGLFVVNTVRLTPSAKSQLRGLAKAFDNAASIRCEGYADYAGTAARNVVLARGRANAVCGFMADENAGLKTSTVSYGPKWPAVIGGKSEDRRLNRRVVVEVTNARPVVPPTPPVPPAPEFKVPGPPVLEDIKAHGGSVAYAYTPPTDDGGSPITGYEVTTGEGWAPVLTQLPGACLATCDGDDWLYGIVLDLEDGAQVDLRVRAVNKVGAGAPSNNLQTQIKGEPSVPTFDTWIGDNGVITTTFKAPEKNGGSAITGYQVSYDGGEPFDLDLDLTAAGPYSSSHDGFDNGTTHNVQVRARNQWGWGMWSDPIQVLVATVPDAPWLDDPDPVGTSIAFTLDAPEFDGGLPVTSYKITTDGGQTWNPLTLEQTTMGYRFELNDLELGHEYKVRVLAVNARGEGGLSKVRTFTPALAPSAPTGLDVKTDDGEIAVVFGAPLHDNGAEVTSYDVSFNGGESWWYDVATEGPAPWVFTMNDFVNGHTYDVRVRANNRVGHGAEASADDVLVATKPGMPVVFGIEPADKSALLMFGAPQTNGGSAVTSYEVSLDNGAWTPLSFTPDPLFPEILRASVPGLVNGQSYGVRLRAVNVRGAGADTESVPVTPSTVPDAPTDVVADADGTTVTVSFDQGSDGGSEVIRHEVRVDDGPWVTATVVDGTITLTDQVAGPHTYAVRAVNERGNSLAATSNEVTVVAPPVVQPAAPSGVKRWGMGGSGNQGYYGLLFTPGATGGATVIGWEARIDDGDWVSLLNVSEFEGDIFGQLYFTCDGFCEMPIADHEYVVVRAVTANGPGLASDPAPLHLPEDGGGIP